MMSSSVPTKHKTSRIFDIGDLRSCHFCDLPITSQWEKSTPLYLLWRKHIWVESYRIEQLWTIRVKICIAYPSKGHLRSPEVTNRYLPITFDQKEIETWDWCQYVRLGQANPIICNMTHFGHQVTLAWLDLRSNFDLDLSKSFYIWFDAPKRDKHDGVKFVALPLKLKMWSSKNRFGKFWNFDPWGPQFWHEQKKWPNWFRNAFSRSFERCLSFFSTATRSRDHGGGAFKRPPPPSRRWKIQRPSRARVKSFHFRYLCFFKTMLPQGSDRPVVPMNHESTNQGFRFRPLACISHLCIFHSVS